MVSLPAVSDDSDTNLNLVALGITADWVDAAKRGDLDPVSGEVRLNGWKERLGLRSGLLA